MPRGKIRVATCQFAESFQPRRNLATILRYLRKAKQRRAEVVHFHEAALSGYLARPDAPALGEIDWPALRQCAEAVCAEARRRKLWVILGSAHPLTPPHKPTNCLYLISPQGKVRGRYDKRFCTTGDLKAYTPGDRFSIFRIHGVVCSMLICYDLRFPELYRALKRRGVRAIFQSFHNAYMDGPGVHEHIMRQTVQAQAGFNYVYFSMNNSSGYYSRWPSAFIQPDGVIAASLRRNRAGLMVNTIDTARKFYDAGSHFSGRAMRGILHSGTLVKDPRLSDRTGL